MIQFYSSDISETLTLNPDDSAHCCRVLRMKEGDDISIVDGKGYRYSAKITSAHPKHTEVEIVEKEFFPSHWPVRITLAVAPTKNVDRMEWFVEKAVEMGIDRIVLLKCRHSERKIVKTDRLLKIAVSAMKQSLKTFLPEITEMIDFKSFIESVSESGSELFMGYCDKNYPKQPFVKNYKPGRDVVIMIGPEGDFSQEEVDMAVKTGFLPVTFGQSRLRTETAALYAVEAVHILNDLKS